MSSTTPARTRRLRRALKTIVPAGAAAAVTALSFAAFTDDARNDGNRATAASVTITEDVAASAPLFDLADWKPGDGDTVSRCIGITNDGSIALPLSVRFAGAPAGELGAFVDMKVERGTRDAATDDASCASFDADASAPVVFDGTLDTFPTTEAAALGDKGQPLAPGAERAYRVTWHLRDDEAAEGKSVSGVSFVWKATS